MTGLALHLLAQESLPYSYRHWFVQPLPVWDYWWALLIPLCIGIAIVYKSIKCRSMDQVPREAAVILFWILVGIVAAAIALGGVVRAMEW